MGSKRCLLTWQDHRAAEWTHSSCCCLGMIKSTAFQDGKARGYMTPPLELLTVVGFWGKANQFSWRIWLLLSRPHSSGGSIPKNTWAAYTGLSGLFPKMKRETKLGRNGDGSGRNRKKSGVNPMKNYMHIKNSQRINKNSMCESGTIMKHFIFNVMLSIL